jgi:hypothetical protein
MKLRDLFHPVTTPYGKGFIQDIRPYAIMVFIRACDMVDPTPSIIHNKDSRGRDVTDAAGVIMWFPAEQVIP